MRKKLAIGTTLVATLALVGCPNQGNYVPRSSGSLGLTSDDATLFVADTDHNRVTIIATATMEVLGHIPVGSAPERILVGPDDTVWVTNRAGRTVMRIPAGSMEVEATGSVGGEPVGMTLTEDGNLLVANSTSGTVSVLDAQTLGNVGEIRVGGTPWAVTALGKTAYVTDLLSSRVAIINVESGELEDEMEIEHEQSENCFMGNGPQRVPNQPADVVLSPDGDRAYIAHVLARTGTDGFTNDNLNLAVAPAVSTASTSRNMILSASTPASDPDRDYPGQMLASTDDEFCAAANQDSMDAPSSLVVDSTGEWIYVADHNSNALAIVSARNKQWPTFLDPERGIVDLVRVGARPTGLAVRGDLSAAYVHNAFDYSISVVERQGERLVTTNEIVFNEPQLTPAQENGRRLFYSAVDPRMTEPDLGGVSCSSCHPDGRTDSLNWSLAGGRINPIDPDNRIGIQTPALWDLADTAPFAWDGSSPDLDSLAHVMVSWMGGRGLAQTEAEDILAYMDTISPPDNPAAEILPQAQLDEGRILFQSNCAGCHAGTSFTDGQQHPTASGGGLVNTPTLKGVFATGPYLHDGSARTLQEAFSRGLQTGHNADGLNAVQKEALEVYLKTL
ncbi:MAG: hypothetical protein P1V51_09655 [Deltaproteobacteria bacterium]|nr:hypothetical protein [Deltaproteobacteria bacterium]